MYRKSQYEIASAYTITSSLYLVSLFDNPRRKLAMKKKYFSGYTLQEEEQEEEEEELEQDASDRMKAEFGEHFDDDVNKLQVIVFKFFSVRKLIFEYANGLS